MSLTILVSILFKFISAIVIFLSLGFLLTFFQERNYRAFFLGLFLFLPAVLFFSLASLNIFSIDMKIIAAIDLIVVFFAIAMIIKIPASELKTQRENQSRIDERDAFFHRFYFLRPGMAEFDRYYQMHPEKKRGDDAIRQLPDLGEPGSRGYHPVNSQFQSATFDIIGKFNKPALFPAETKTDFPQSMNAEEMTERIKGFARYLGADLVGITELNPAYVYSNNARGEGPWGSSIELNHKYAIAIAVEMKLEMIRQAPKVAVTTESSLRYMDTAKIALILARFISLLGHEARAHIDGNYRVMCIPIAADAGLGELGRHGLLITPRYGSRVRISVVTTNLPLISDRSVNFGVQDFCQICKKCAQKCPSGSIESGEKKWINGAKKWQSQQDSCYRFWRLQGSDCSVCINVCPYSYPNTLMHNVIRFFVKRNNLSRLLIYWGDKLFYDKNNKISYPLPAWHRE